MGKDSFTLLGTAFPCSCGKTHRIRTKRILVGKGVLAHMPGVLRELGFCGKALVLFDDATYEAAGKSVCDLLSRNGFAVIPGLLKKQERFPFLEPDEEARSQVGEFLFHRPDFLVAVGSGVINDLTKFIAHRVGLPYVAVATAPSMDGYVSPGAPMLVGGYKVTYDATPPVALFADTEVLCCAPLSLIQAGFADLVGKITANADWTIRRVLFGEDFCDALWEHTVSFLEALSAHAEGVQQRDEQAITVLTQALIQSGLSMEMIGDSRPASGGEHLIAHHLEMMALHRGMHPSFHGLRVGAATCIVWNLFQRFLAEELPQRGRLKATVDQETLKVHFGPLFPFIEKPAQKKLNILWPEINFSTLKRAVEEKIALLNPLHLLERAGIPTSFETLGFPPVMVREACLFARFLRDRVTLLDLLDHLGALQEFLDTTLSE
jgi:glycerol-1-phosphate dehydrogenase [NAD(P)+]